jgi:hypothetical protein
LFFYVYSALDDNAALSQREQKTTAWLVLFLTITAMFSMSTFSLIESLFSALDQNGWYFSQNPVLDERIGPDALTTYILEFVYNAIFTLEVSCSHASISFVRYLTPRNIQYLVGDAIVLWRTWALWKGSWTCYVPITMWIIALGKHL